MKFGLGAILVGVFLLASACQEETAGTVPSTSPAPNSPALQPPSPAVEKPAAVEAVPAADPKPTFKLKMESITAIPKKGTVTGTVTKVEPAPADPNSKSDPPKVKLKGLTIQAE
jgi:hypothetical protein